ncbi:MAG: GNAT family N-acetyltransferase [Candidatus Marinimicrobia bacterium]|nr:GNAT family N-acetyltransferase [Candidatus Neomarinimicrobiota bacterium]
MEQLTFNISEKSRTRVIAFSPDEFRIELMEYVGVEDIPVLMEVSESLASEYGSSARLTKTTIRKYFNYPKTLPFVARFRGVIVGYIIGVPLEYFARDAWAKFDSNLGQGNTLYTYAYVILSRYQGNGFAQTLKRVYLNWARKHNYRFVSGHVLEGIARQFSAETTIVKRFTNWHGSGQTFEYYRRPLVSAATGVAH